MARNDQYATEIARFHKTSAESRLRVIESQLALAFTLCAVAETQIRYDRPDEAIQIVNRVRHHAETIGFHVSESNHLPTTAISALQQQLTKLKKRTEEIELCIRQR